MDARTKFTLSIIFVIILAVLLMMSEIIPGKWKRPTPLINPIQIINVQSGTITLVDGRTLTPAGINPKDNISTETFDQFLRIATAQGVVIEQHLTENRALITIEPKFYNWCGNSNKRWPGSYTTCDLSLLAIRLNYAQHDQSQTDLSPRTQWRLEGITSLMFDDYPIRMSTHSTAFRYESLEYEFNDIDSAIQLMTKTSPPE